MRLEEEIKQKAFACEFTKLYVNLMYTGAWAQAMGNQLLKDHDLTVQQFNVLRILRGQCPNPASVNLIIDRMLDKSSNASRLIDKLEKKGWVTRQRCSEDRRQVDVCITDAGLELLSELDSVMNHRDDFSPQITVEEASQLNALLDKLRG